MFGEINNQSVEKEMTKISPANLIEVREMVGLPKDINVSSIDEKEPTQNGIHLEKRQSIQNHKVLKFISSVDVPEKYSNPVKIEKHVRAQEAETRHEIIQDILLNNGKYTYSYQTSFIILGGVFLGIAINLGTLLIPMHDTIQEPEYFYENSLIVGLVYIPFFAISSLGCYSQNYGRC